MSKLYINVLKFIVIRVRNMEKKIRILLCEDQEIVSEGIANSINSDGEMEIVKTLNDAKDIIYALRSMDIDIVLSDIITKNKNNVLNYVPEIKKEFPNVKIITITGFPDISFMEKAKKAGVNSFIYKNVSSKELNSLIKNTFSGYYVYPGVSTTNDLIISSLNEKELKILRLYISGVEREDIAKELFMSNSSVKAHITSILQKTGFPSLARVAIYAISNNLIVPDSRNKND